MNEASHRKIGMKRFIGLSGYTLESNDWKSNGLEGITEQLVEKKVRKLNRNL